MKHFLRLAAAAAALATATPSAAYDLAVGSKYAPFYTLYQNGRPAGFNYAYAPPASIGVNIALTAQSSSQYVIASPYASTGQIAVFDAATSAPFSSFYAFNEDFAGGVSIAATQMGGRDVLVAGAGTGGGPHVKLFNLADASVLMSFFAFAPSFQGGVSVGAQGGLIAVGTATETSHVKVFNGKTGAEQLSFFAFDPSFRGGVNVAVGGSDGAPVIVVGAQGEGGGHVKVFDGLTGSELYSFFAFDPAYRGHVSVSTGVYDGKDVIIVGGDGPQIKVYEAGTGASVTTLYSQGGATVAGAARNMFGTSADNPILPTNPTAGDGIFVFDLTPTADQIVYIDPDYATGYDYEILSGANLITSAIFPVLAGDPDGYEIYRLGDISAAGLLGTVLGGESFSFGSGVTGFSLRGIAPGAGVEVGDPDGFVTGLAFANGNAISLSQSAIAAAVPEPATWGMLVLGFAAVGGALRTKRRRLAPG